MRVNVNLNEDLLTKLDEVAKKLNISRSAFISVCCSSNMNAYYDTIDTEQLVLNRVEEALELEKDAKIMASLIDKK